MARSIEELQTLTREQLKKLWEDASNEKLEKEKRGIALFEYGVSLLVNNDSFFSQPQFNKLAKECIESAAKDFEVFEALMHLAMGHINLQKKALMNQIKKEEALADLNQREALMAQNDKVRAEDGANQLAFKFFQAAARQDNAERGGIAWAALGNCYAKGIGTAMHPENAYLSYQKAAKFGCAEALCTLGWMSENGYAKSILKSEFAHDFYDKKSASNFYYQAAMKQNEAGLNNLKNLAHKHEKLGNSEEDVEMQSDKKNHDEREIIADFVANYFLALYYATEIISDEDNVTIIKAKNHEQAYFYIQRAADFGSRHAQYTLYQILRTGAYGTLKVTVDHQKSLHYLKLAAKNNLPEAQFYLAKAYHERKASTEAKAWFEQAANQGHKDAQYTFSQYLWVDANKIKPKDKQLLEKAFQYLKAAALQNLVSAQYKLALAYENGIGVEASLTEANFWLIKAADNGHGLSQYLVGFHLQEKAHLAQEQKGDTNEIKAKFEEAYQYFYKAAHQTYADHSQAVQNKYYAAMTELGKCYYLGEGIAKDYPKAIHYFNHVVKHVENVQAKFYIAKSLIQGQGIDANPELGLKSLLEIELRLREKFSRLPLYLWTTTLLGLCSQVGRGTNKDLNAALGWYKIGADRGYRDAVERYKILSGYIQAHAHNANGMAAAGAGAGRTEPNQTKEQSKPKPSRP